MFLEELVLVLVCANRLGHALKSLGWHKQYAEINWDDVRDLRNEYEHKRAGDPPLSAVTWFSGNAGTVSTFDASKDQSVDLQRLLAVCDEVERRVQDEHSGLRRPGA
jgi:hypothetical protein